MSIIPKPYAAVAAVLIVGVVGLAAVVGLAPRGGVGVSGPTSTPAATPPASAAPTIRPTTAPTKAVAATPALPAPAELQGRWRAEIPDVAILTFTATGYTINWLGVGTGRIEVEGDKITFLGSRDPEQCPDGGTYRWSIEGDKLHLEPVGTDPCPFQTEWAGNRTYTRYD